MHILQRQCCASKGNQTCIFFQVPLSFIRASLAWISIPGKLKLPHHALSSREGAAVFGSCLCVPPTPFFLLNVSNSTQHSLLSTKPNLATTKASERGVLSFCKSSFSQAEGTPKTELQHCTLMLICLKINWVTKLLQPPPLPAPKSKHIAEASIACKGNKGALAGVTAGLIKLAIRR